MFYVAVCWIHHNQAGARKTDAAIKKREFATNREDNFAAPPSLRRREVVLYFTYGGTQDTRVFERELSL